MTSKCSFSRDRRGNVSLTFALMTLPLLAMVGAAVDFGVVMNVQSKLAGAADSAALAGLSATQASLTAGNSAGTATAAGEAAALSYFNATAGNTNGTLTSAAATVTKTGGTVTSQFNFAYATPTYIMPILGVSSVPFKGSATATASMGTYVNIHIVIDNSQSMGVGATNSDQQIIYNESKTLKSNDDAYACAFACHYADSTSTDISNKTRQAGASLRIDVAKKAVYDALATLPSNATVNVAIYTFANKLVNVVPLTSNMATAQAAVAPSLTNPASIDLANANNDGGTNITYALSSLNGLIAAPGNGLTPATAQGYVILVTDGVQDSDMKYLQNGNYADKSDPNFTVMSPCVMTTCQYFSNFGIYMQAMDPSACAPIKSKGYTMLTLNVNYIVPSPAYQSTKTSLNNVFTYIQSYLLNSIPTNMATCATSSNLAYSANTPAEIQAAMSGIISTVGTISQARLSQ